MASARSVLFFLTVIFADKNEQGFELVRVSTTGTVELIVGDPTPRLPTTAVPNTRNFPLSGLPAGFGWPFNAYAWQIESFKVRFLKKPNQTSFFY